MLKKACARKEHYHGMMESICDINRMFIRCDCRMCLDQVGNNYCIELDYEPDRINFPDCESMTIDKEPFDDTSVYLVYRPAHGSAVTFKGRDYSDCKLFDFFAQKCQEFDVPIPSKSHLNAPRSFNLWKRLGHCQGHNPSVCNCWRCEIYNMPYCSQIRSVYRLSYHLSTLIHDSSEPMPPFNEWFSFGGICLL